MSDVAAQRRLKHDLLQYCVKRFLAARPCVVSDCRLPFLKISGGSRRARVYAGSGQRSDALKHLAQSFGFGPGCAEQFRKEVACVAFVFSDAIKEVGIALRIISRADSGKQPDLVGYDLVFFPGCRPI